VLLGDGVLAACDAGCFCIVLAFFVLGRISADCFHVNSVCLGVLCPKLRSATVVSFFARFIKILLLFSVYKGIHGQFICISDYLRTLSQ